MMMMMFVLLFLYFSLETENDKIVVVCMLSFIRSLFFGVKSNTSGEKPVVSTRIKTKSATTRLADSTPTKQVVLLEEDEEDIDLRKGIIRSEVNFLAYPFLLYRAKTLRIG
jgi:hypothetical protein